jgi:hypothetical protein
MKEIETYFTRNKQYQDTKGHEEEIADKLIKIYANTKHRMSNMQKARDKMVSIDKFPHKHMPEK